MMAEFEHAQSLSSTERQYVCICDNFTTPVDCIVAHVQGRETLHHFVRCEAKPFLDAGLSIDEALRQLTTKEKVIQHVEERLQQFCAGSSELLSVIEKAKMCVCEFIAAKKEKFASISDSFQARVSALVKSCENSVSTSPTLADLPMAELELGPLYKETLEEFSLKLAYVLAPILKEKNVNIDVGERIQQWKRKLKRSRQNSDAQRAAKRPKRDSAYST